jgi:hypothetical protein
MLKEHPADFSRVLLPDAVIHVTLRATVLRERGFHLMCPRSLGG